MTNAELVDALHRAIRELERVGEQSVIVEARVNGVTAILQDMIDRTLEDEMDAETRIRRRYEIPQSA